MGEIAPVRNWLVATSPKPGAERRACPRIDARPEDANSVFYAPHLCKGVGCCRLKACNSPTGQIRPAKMAWFLGMRRGSWQGCEQKHLSLSSRPMIFTRPLSDPIRRRLRADRKEKRVTHRNETSNKTTTNTGRIDANDPNQSQILTATISKALLR